MSDQRALLAAGDLAAAAFERAALLDQRGRNEAARAAYLDVLALDASHAGALNGLGLLLDRTGYHTAARSAFARAVETNPGDTAGRGNLANALLDDGDVDAARREYEIVLALDPANVVAQQCLAIVLLRLGETERAAELARSGFRAGASTWPYRGDEPPIPLLAIHSALGGNAPIDRFLDDRTFRKSTIVAEFYPPSVPLPPHALAVNLIGDASRCRAALDAAAALLATTDAPVVNAPAGIAATSRQRTSRLARLPGVVAPLTAAFSRSQLTVCGAAALLANAGFGWPLIVRAPGFQTGRHCVLVERFADLAPAVATLPGDELLGIAFVDVRSASDAHFRKYRVMIVDGELFPLHLAISPHWMVHYFSAEMAGRPEHQAEEAAFLSNMCAVLGPRAVAALRAFAARLALDYGGIDFGVDARGRVVVFEANATMIVPPSEREAQAHRRAAVERIERAVRSMLLARAATAAVC